jgi:2-haloacid dehalogenase
MDGMVAALMLDFYGTVVHEDDAVLAAICAQVASTLTAPVPVSDIARQWSGWFAEECASSAGEAFKSQCDIVRLSLARLLDALGSPEDPDQLTLAQFAYWRRPPLFEDAHEFLRRVKIPVCVVSNIDRADIEAAIDYHGLAFDHVVTSEDAKSCKPRPELFELALDLVGARRDAVLHAGDSRSSDVAGANNAGISVAWVNRSARPRPAEVSPWAEVASLAELADLLKTG